MNPKPDLAPMLRKLRMDGVLQSLEARNRQAIESRMSYMDFLSLLVSDEVARREQLQFDSRLRRAAFRSGKTIEQFDFDFNPTINTALVHDLMTCRFVREKDPVLIVGPCGTGKSHIAQAIGHEAVRQGHHVKFTAAADLLDSLYAARATGGLKRKFRQLARIDLLIIDDFGLRPMKPPADEDLHDLIAERYERAATMVTSNLDFPEWGHAFANQLLGAATLDRLRHGAYRLVLDGQSYRSPRDYRQPGASGSPDRGQKTVTESVPKDGVKGERPDRPRKHGADHADPNPGE